jgi:hypothetical protein
MPDSGQPHTQQGTWVDSDGQPSGPVVSSHRRVIHVDDERDRQTASQQTAGRLYEDVPVTPRQWSRARCFQCGASLTGIASTKPYFCREVSSGGKTVTRGLPPAPVVDLARLDFTSLPQTCYTLEPCGCKVDDKDMSALAAIAAGRASGRPSRAGDVARLAILLPRLYAAQSRGNKLDCDYWIAAVIDTIQRLDPGRLQSWPPLPLEEEVVRWAVGRGMRVTPPHARPDGSVGWPTADQLDFESAYPPDYPLPAYRQREARPRNAGTVRVDEHLGGNPAMEAVYNQAANNRAKTAAVKTAYSEALVVTALMTVTTNSAALIQVLRAAQPETPWEQSIDLLRGELERHLVNMRADPSAEPGPALRSFLDVFASAVPGVATAGGPAPRAVPAPGVSEAQERFSRTRKRVIRKLKE